MSNDKFMEYLDDIEKEVEKEIYGYDYMSEGRKDYEKAYVEIMQIVCKHCKECTTGCPIGHKVWEFVKGEL